MRLRDQQTLGMTSDPKKAAGYTGMSARHGLQCDDCDEELHPEINLGTLPTCLLGTHIGPIYSNMDDGTI